MISPDAAIAIWNAVWIRITEVRHGLLIGDKASAAHENSLFLFVNGKGVQIALREQYFSIKSHALLHVGQGQRFMIDASEGEAEYYLVAYQAEESQSAGREMLRQIMKGNLFNHCVAIRPANAVFFKTQFYRMADQWHAGKRNALKVKSAFYAIVSAFYEEMAHSAAQPVKPDMVEMARRYLERHFAEDISIQMLAEQLCVGRTTLYERFKREVGQSPRQYVMDLRLEAARRALCESVMTHQEIAVSYGLIDKDYFSKVFKRRYGIPPGAYRDAHAIPGVTHQKTAIAAQEKAQEVLCVKNLGRIHRYVQIPERVVCLNYAAAEMCVALGAAGRIVGVAGAEGALEDCASALQDVISKAHHLPGRAQESGMPSFQTICGCRPDLAVGTAYSFNTPGGIEEAAVFEREGIHVYALKSTYTLGGTFEDTYEDIANLGRILGAQARADALIASMRERQRQLPALGAGGRPVRVFSFDAPIGDKAFTCGCSLEAFLIRMAGGINVFENRAKQFAAVSWEEVAQANPEVILVHRFFDGEDGAQKVALLRARPEIANTDAVRYGRIHIIGMKKVFPAIDNVDTAILFSRWFKASSNAAH